MFKTRHYQSVQVLERQYPKAPSIRHFGNSHCLSICNNDGIVVLKILSFLELSEERRVVVDVWALAARRLESRIGL